MSKKRTSWQIAKRREKNYYQELLAASRSFMGIDEDRARLYYDKAVAVGLKFQRQTRPYEELGEQVVGS